MSAKHHPADSTVAAWTSFVHRGRTVLKGAKLAGDDEIVQRLPGFFVPLDAPDSAVAEAREAVYDAGEERQAALAERYRDRARKRLAELDVEAKPRRRILAGRDRHAEAREDANAARAAAAAAAKLAAARVRAEREQLARRIGAA